MTRLVKLLAASVVLGLMMAAASALRPYYEHQIFHRKEVSVVMVSGLSLGVYAALLLVFRAVTPAEVRAALKRSPRAKGADDPAAVLL